MSSYADIDDVGLVHQLEQGHRDLVRAQFSLAAGRLENTASLKGIRAGIARLETELRRREIAGGMAKNTLRARHRSSFVANDAVDQAAAGSFLADVVDTASE